MSKPEVSIIMSSYNDSDYLKEAIDSVFQQSFLNWEFIIINDASSDNTEDIVREFSQRDKRIRYFRNKKNIGQTLSLNKGIDLAKGGYIARIDGDDIWMDKNKLKVQVDFLKTHAEYGLVGSFWINVNTYGNKISESTYPTDDESIRQYLLIENCFLHSSILMRKSILKKVGRYDMKYEYAQDYDLWLRIGKVSKLYNLPKFMVQYRINPQGITLTKYRKQLRDTYKIIKTYKHDYPNFIKANILWHLRGYIPKKNNNIIALKNMIRNVLIRKGQI